MSVAQSLGRAGVSVHVLSQASDPVRHSRYCRTFTDLGGGDGMQARWLEWLRTSRRRAVILPADDHGLELVARHRAELVEAGHMPVEADDRVVLAMLDKDSTYRLAGQAGVPAPRVIAARTQEELDLAGRGIGFPCGLKPRHSHLYARHPELPDKLLLAHDEVELRDAFARTRRLGLDMLVTEIVPGGDDRYCSYYSYLDERGNPLFHFTKRQIRQHPTRFGLACYHVTEWHPDVAELGLRFFQSIGLRGIGNVEFKRDPRDGQLKLIECNHRFTAANELVRLAGVDLALFAYNRLVGRDGPPIDAYREGVRLWHPVEDLRAFLAYRSRGELSAGEWTRSLVHRQHFPVFSWRDPKPSLASLAAKPRRWLGRRARSPAPDRVAGPLR